MKLRPIVLSIVPPDRRLRQRPPAEAAELRARLREVERSVLDEYKWRCDYCGYAEDGTVVKRMIDSGIGGTNMSSQLGLIAYNGDYGDFRPENLGVCCVFCRAALEINEVHDHEQWSVAQLPGLPQYVISWLSRVSILAQHISEDIQMRKERGETVDLVEMASEGSVQATIDYIAGDLVQGLSQARKFALMSSVLQFGNGLSRMYADDPERYGRRNDLLCGFRLVPLDLHAVGDWTGFARYTRLMIKASGMGPLDSYRSFLTAARQVFEMLHKAAFPAGDPLGMTRLLGDGN